MEKENNIGHKIVTIIILIFLIIFLLYLYCRYVGVKGIITKEYRVESEILSKNFSGLKIVHFSDVLYKSTIDMNDIEELVKKINVFKPDLVVFTGDLVADKIKLKEEEEKNLIENLKSLYAKYGKYAVKGDTDYSLDSYEKIMSDSGFMILNNSFDRIYKDNEEFIYIVGLSNNEKETINLEEAFSFYLDEDRRYIITLVHSGSAISKIDKSTYEVDLILGGHSLGGSVVVPFYGPLLLDEECGSYYLSEYKKGITNIFISSGIGTRKYPYRFLNKPSFNLYRLKSLKDI